MSTDKTKDKRQKNRAKKACASTALKISKIVIVKKNSDPTSVS